MATRKQTQAAKRNVKKAQKAAVGQKTIAHLPAHQHRPGQARYGRAQQLRRAGRSPLSAAAIRKDPSIAEPAAMTPPSTASSNWPAGTPTVLFPPGLSVNWRRKELTSCFLAVARISRLVVMAEM